MSIVGNYPFNFVNGQTADATQVDANFAKVQTDVNANALPLAGGTMTGALTLAADAVAALQPTTLEQVTAAIAASTSGLLLNRVINGDMNVDQYVGGGVYTITTSDTYGSCDRWSMRCGAGVVATAQQSKGGSYPGFAANYQYTVTTGAAPSATDINRVWQKIEGLNIYDAQFGTANAKSLSITFAVETNVLGTHSVAVQNGANNRSYIANYVVASNGWAIYTITVPGDITGAWAADNTTGLALIFDLGSGTNFEAAAGAWATGNTFRTSGSVRVAGSTGSTWNLTAVQVTVGTAGGSFNRRLEVQELALCQRYYFPMPGSFTTSGAGPKGTKFIASVLVAQIDLPVTMRAAPTLANPTPPGWTNAALPAAANSLSFLDYGASAFLTITGTLSLSPSAAPSAINWTPQTCFLVATASTSFNGSVNDSGAFIIGAGARLGFTAEL